jgi:hypothetical protein
MAEAASVSNKREMPEPQRAGTEIGWPVPGFSSVACRVGFRVLGESAAVAVGGLSESGLGRAGIAYCIPIHVRLTRATLATY